MALVAAAGWAENSHSMDWMVALPVSFAVFLLIGVLGAAIVASMTKRRTGGSAQSMVARGQFTLRALFQLMLGVCVWLALIQSMSLLQIVVMWNVLLVLYIWRCKWNVVLIHSIIPATALITAVIVAFLSPDILVNPFSEKSPEPLSIFCDALWMSGVVSFPLSFGGLPEA